MRPVVGRARQIRQRLQDDVPLRFVQARVLVLKDSLDYSFSVSLTGMPVGTAESYARRARSALRPLLQRRELA